MANMHRFGCRADSVSRCWLFAGLGFGLLGLSFASGCGSSKQPVGATAVQTPTPSPTTGGQQPTGSGQSGGGADASASQGDAGNQSTNEGGNEGAGDGGGEGGSAQPDCTPADWKDPGTVTNPSVVAVSADAGTTHEMQGATQSFAGLAYYPPNKGLSDYDYVEEEFFFTGTSPAYTTRMVVHRPKDPAKFTGTVLMEWYNVTGGIDIAPLWTLSREYMMRAGHVHVGVSAQKVGADALKTYDSVRYAPINHPGDSAANAIFSQAAMAIRSQTDKLLGPCMPVQKVVALGQSQSSVYLGTYLSSQQPTDKMYDGFFLHTDPSGSTPSGNPSVPVFVLFTMTEGTNPIDSQPNVVQWEVAGATHNDNYLTTIGGVEVGGNSTIKIACANPMNVFPSFWVWDAALDWMHRWVRKGEKPPSAAALQSTTDQDGNAQGGVRIQDIDVPIATYTKSNTASGTDLISSFACALSGSVVAFTPARLLQLYPTHDAYVQKYTQTADKAVTAGFMLQSDRDIAVGQAMSAAIPK
jgi:hypothetical protein